MTQKSNDVELEVNAIYELTIKEKLKPDYTMSTLISEWLHDNLSNLTDDEDKPIFNKVNYGFNEDNLRNFGNLPVCDVYIDNMEYDQTYDSSKPSKAHTIIIFYFKGANNKAYEKLCKIHDYIMQEFANNEDFQVLPGIVRDTNIDNSRIMTQQIRKQWGVMGAFELSHIIF